MKYILLLMMAFGWAIGFGQTIDVAPVKGTSYYGEKVKKGGAMSTESLVKELNDTESLNARVRGTVEAVCQNMGCWMKLSAEDGQSIMVRFKDYGFFVPKDIAGREVVIEGLASRELTPVDELRHYAEDAGKSKEEIESITEPKLELKFMADGVALLRKKG